MKKLLLPFIFSLTVLSAFGQNQFPLNKNTLITIDGGYINMIRPSTTGAWARGIMYTDGTKRIAGIGILGSSEETGSIYLGFGDRPWIDTYGLHVLRNGSVGIGTTSPGAKLHIHGVANGPGETASSIMLGKNNGPEIRAIQARTDDDVQELAFRVKSSASNADPNFEAVRIKYNGYVGIGTSIPDAPLTVKGKIHAQEVKVTATAGGADFVFADDYALPKLSEVAAFVKENKHLPEIPSAAEMEANGLHLAEMNIKLLQKLEELTLYTIEQEKKLEAQQLLLNAQAESLSDKKKQLEAILKRVEKLEMATKP